MLHLGGKIEIASKVPLKTRDDLSRAYTPGVARICQAIVAPAPVITVVASATGFESGEPSTRIVIPYPGEVDAIYTTPYKRSPASPKPGTM